MDLSVLIVCGLATWQIVEIWRHGSIFGKARMRAEALSNSDSAFYLVGDLLNCPFCLSVWVGFISYGLWCWHYTSLVVIGFAISRLANLGNDFAYFITRSPGHRPTSH